MNSLAIKNGYYIAITKNPTEFVVEFGKGISEETYKARVRIGDGYVYYYTNDNTNHSMIVEQKATLEEYLDTYIQNIVYELNVNPDLIFLKDGNNNLTKFYKNENEEAT